MEQTLDRVIVSLEVKNDTGSNLTNVVAHDPLVQVETGTKFIFGKTASPRSYTVVSQGSAVRFQWQGRLRSSGAVGIAASASAVAPNGESIDTPQVDCGTIGGTPPEPPAPEEPADTASEAASCGGCHSSPHMAFVASKWRTSQHASTYGPAQGNTYCAGCHAPLQAEADATSARNQTVPQAQWLGVTCSACHPPEADRIEWETPIATYDVTTRTYEPARIWDADELCTQCHSGEYAQGFVGYGKVMHEAGVRCIDCHMAKIPADDPNVGQWAAHDFKVAANLPHSCGTYPGGCHSRRPETWAARILQLGPMHPPQQSR